MPHPKKCPIRHVPARQPKKYCSVYCESRKDTQEIACECGHPDCKVKSLKDGRFHIDTAFARNQGFIAPCSREWFPKGVPKPARIVKPSQIRHIVPTHSFSELDSDAITTDSDAREQFPPLPARPAAIYVGRFLKDESCPRRAPKNRPAYRPNRLLKCQALRDVRKIGDVPAEHGLFG